MKRVVVTGIGALTPIGNNAHDFWENLKNGVSGAGNITKFDASTTLLIERIPRCARRLATHRGDVPTETPLM